MLKQYIFLLLLFCNNIFFTVRSFDLSNNVYNFFPNKYYINIFDINIIYTDQSILKGYIMPINTFFELSVYTNIIGKIPFLFLSSAQDFINFFGFKSFFQNQNTTYKLLIGLYSKNNTRAINNIFSIYMGKMIGLLLYSEEEVNKMYRHSTEESQEEKDRKNEQLKRDIESIKYFMFHSAFIMSKTYMSSSNEKDLYTLSFLVNITYHDKKQNDLFNYYIFEKNLFRSNVFFVCMGAGIGYGEHNIKAYSTFLLGIKLYNRSCLMIGMLNNSLNCAIGIRGNNLNYEFVIFNYLNNYVTH